MKLKTLALLPLLALAFTASKCTVINQPAALAGPAVFPDGFNNLPNGHWIRGRGDAVTMPYPVRDNTYWNDFWHFNGTTGADWTITDTEAGGSDTTYVSTDGDDGVLLITTDSNEDDGAMLQSVGEVATFTSGKESYFEARFQASEATQIDWVFGLGVRDTTPLATADAVYFQKDDGDTQIDIHSTASSVATTSSNIGTFAASTWTKIAFYYDGGTSIVAAINDVVVATITATPTTTELTISFGVQAGSAASRTMSVDYIYYWKER